MSFNPTPSQALLLFGLLAAHGECAQANVMPAVTKADREALENAKLISVEKKGRGLYLSLSDAGWNWAAGNLSAELPPAHLTLHEMLARLGEFLEKNDETLAAFIGAKPKEKDEPKPIAAKRKSTRTSSKTAASAKEQKPGKTTKAKAGTGTERKPGKTPKPRPPSATALRKRIEVAYLALTGGRKNESVRLARLRRELSDLDRTVVDAALGRILKGDKKASLMRHDDPNQLDQADHAAAFSPAGEPFHIIWIAS
ncbi:hypothetical protein RHAL1_03258 [Beijerinckiaceae bacterium RH AL1]|nr:hypothetical protein [Beijerinckiaceae bacterium]VVB48313.1 hypothetical protein RHCH11_RHCH11_03193 [Beijerinckiaceae bacterium RH CH11]VVB48394.1 hypothetical protein RHAL8_03189 [Beijerinckiaceae bacterium RH AL8]VVC56331.1 hypothetical protein RHAL1_03258 [Beijerinckiaceae bacterium RH AL1]